MKQNPSAGPSKKTTGAGPKTRAQSGWEKQKEGRDLLAAIENQIIPRLILARGRDSPAVSCGHDREAPTQAVIEEIGRMAVAQESRAIIDRLLEMGSAGLSFKGLLLEVIAPAADWLGERWSDDTLTFADVTAGAGVLERVAAALGEHSDPPLRHGELIILTAAPGEQHVLPMHLLGETLRQEGWEVLVDPSIPADDIRQIVSEDDVAAIGFTCRDLERMIGFTDFLSSVRAASRNTDIKFYVGGAKGLALRASSYGAVYCNTFDDFLDALNPPKEAAGDDLNNGD